MSRLVLRQIPLFLLKVLYISFYPSFDIYIYIFFISVIWCCTSLLFIIVVNSWDRRNNNKKSDWTNERTEKKMEIASTTVCEYHSIMFIFVVVQLHALYLILGNHHHFHSMEIRHLQQPAAWFKHLLFILLLYFFYFFFIFCWASFFFAVSISKFPRTFLQENIANHHHHHHQHIAVSIFFFFFFCFNVFFIF